MLVLALDSATPTLVAGLARWTPSGGADVLAERAVPSGTKHAELLAPAISGVLADAGVVMADVEAVVTGLGPGPFTGLRVGVVTDARRQEVYWAAYDAGGARVDGPGVVRPEQLDRPGPFVGDVRFAERLGAAVALADVTTTGLLRAAAARLADPSTIPPLVPLYLRRPDATPPTAIKAVSPA